MSLEPRTILVAACGNPWAADDSFGPCVARCLNQFQLAGVEVVDLAMRPAGLLDLLPGRQALAVVDAAQCSAESLGRMLEFDWFDPRRPELLHDDALSSHGLSLNVQLELAQKLGVLPGRVRLFAVGIAGADPAGEMDMRIRRCVKPTARRVAHWCRGIAPARHEQGEPRHA